MRTQGRQMVIPHAEVCVHSKVSIVSEWTKYLPAYFYGRSKSHPSDRHKNISQNNFKLKYFREQEKNVREMPTYEASQLRYVGTYKLPLKTR